MKHRFLPGLRRIGQWLLATLGIGLICLLALEGLVRWWGYAERYIYDPIYTSFPASDEIAYVHKPNLESVRARGEIHIHTDSLGLRTDIPGKIYAPKQPGEIRIAIVGDSITFGEGVADVQETYPAVLETLLAEQIGVPVTVFNFGVSGYSVRDMAATLESRMLALTPDLVIMAMATQDFGLSRTGAVDPIGYVYDPANGLVKEKWRLRKLLLHIRLLYVLRDIRLLHASPPVTSAAPGLPASYEYVLNFRDTAVTNEIPYLIVWLPVLQDNDAFSELVKEQMQADGLKLLDLTYLRDEFSVEGFAASTFDGHPSTLVHGRIATELVEVVQVQLSAEE